MIENDFYRYYDGSQSSMTEEFITISEKRGNSAFLKSHPINAKEANVKAKSKSKGKLAKNCVIMDSINLNLTGEINYECKLRMGTYTKWTKQK